MIKIKFNVKTKKIRVIYLLFIVYFGFLLFRLLLFLPINGFWTFSTHGLLPGKLCGGDSLRFLDNVATGFGFTKLGLNRLTLEGGWRPLATICCMAVFIWLLPIGFLFLLLLLR